MKHILSAAIAAVLSLAAPSLVHAHELVSSTPAANSTASKVRAVTLNFPEPVDPKASRATLTMTAMPGMADHPPMKMSAMKPSYANGGTSLTLSARAPLAAGTYRVDWTTTDSAGHRSGGQFSFTVE